ncbi:hypothetical protein G3H63_09385 [Microbacterium resistens]|uniref:hypothetical protein n=1 Tax=Microbacterium resistens TaxID=156977 RepID=UPI001C59B069|nr:hypothetical protein [Microbacterium resistens]MBW1639282.1 hypothetical protein [Microbacterium resistens]
MVVARWVAVVLAVEVLIVLVVLPVGVLSLILAGAFAALFIFICWTFGAFTRATTESEPKP